MNTKIISIFMVLNCFMLQARAQEGFTNKAEAKNELKDGAKEGKWIEYTGGGTSTLKSDSEGASTYVLTVYKAGKPFGLVREYNISGELYSETPYTNGKINGVVKTYHESGAHLETSYKDGLQNGMEKLYDESGKLSSETPYKDGNKNGVGKTYYESGKLESETPFTKGLPNGVEKTYYETGKLKSETTFTNGAEGITKNYDENGIK